MLTMLKDWKGTIEIGSTQYKDIQSAISENKRLSNDVHIKLYSSAKKSLKSQNTQAQKHINESDEVQITVKTYMTKPATPEFDFMAKWNNDIPMPLRTMQGVRVKETSGMVYMKLHGLAKPTITCYCCGKELTNPISRHYGVGPICLTKLGIMRDISDEDNIKEDLVNIEWEGWVIRSSILEQKLIDV